MPTSSVLVVVQCVSLLVVVILAIMKQWDAAIVTRTVSYIGIFFVLGAILWSVEESMTKKVGYTFLLGCLWVVSAWILITMVLFKRSKFFLKQPIFLAVYAGLGLLLEIRMYLVLPEPELKRKNLYRVNRRPTDLKSDLPNPSPIRTPQAQWTKFEGTGRSSVISASPYTPIFSKIVEVTGVREVVPDSNNQWYNTQIRSMIGKSQKFKPFQTKKTEMWKDVVADFDTIFRTSTPALQATDYNWVMESDDGNTHYLSEYWTKTIEHIKKEIQPNHDLMIIKAIPRNPFG